MSARGPGIEGVVIAVNKPVEGHGGGSRRGHAEEDSHPILGSTAPAVGAESRECRSQKGEGEGEERVVELHQVEILAGDCRVHGLRSPGVRRAGPRVPPPRTVRRPSA